MTTFTRRVCFIGYVALVLSVSALAVTVIPSGAFGLTFTTFDPPGSVYTEPAGINARGQVVGYYFDGLCPDLCGTAHGFLLDQGIFTVIDVPGATDTAAFAINNR